jgi:hypothetical protein
MSLAHSKGHFKIYDINVNFANPQEHVPEAERNNQVIKERVRATYHRLPFSQLTRTMTKILVMESTQKLNFFPSNDGILEYYSPRMMLHQKTLDYKKNCKYSFGSYVQAHDKPNPLNTTAARTLDSIYLQYTDAHQGGHEILHLQIERVIMRKNITELPITKKVVNQVNCIAKQEKCQRG